MIDRSAGRRLGAMVPTRIRVNEGLALRVTHLPDRLRQLGEVMNEHGKEGFLASLVAITANLAMTPAHARGVIDQVLDPTRR